MKTEYLVLDNSAGDDAKISHAAHLLAAGELVAFPTETVYGLGADSRNPKAIARLREVKGRPEEKPFSLLVPSVAHAQTAAGGLSRVAHKLARLYWPGPLTMIVPTPDGKTIGLRLPDHPVARALLARCGFPLSTPSANRTGTAEPLTGRQVHQAFDGQIAAILDGGPAAQGRPSAVVRVENENITVQRQGVIPENELVEVASPTVLYVCTGNTCRSPMAQGFCQLWAQPQPPGTLPWHVLSAGTSANDGERADALAAEAMREKHVDISRHRTRSLNLTLLDSADWIYTMTHAQRDSILALVPSCADRVKLLSPNQTDIMDPVSRSLDCYRQVRDQIAACVRTMLHLP